MGLATLIRRRYFTPVEREAGIAALFMGFFGITEGAIPLAAAKPLQVIPANMIGGAVAGGIAALFGVTDSVPHGGPIVAVFGAVSGVSMYFTALLVGAAVTALVSVLLLGVSARKAARHADAAAPASPAPSPSQQPTQKPTKLQAPVAAKKTVLDYIDERTIVLDVDETDRDTMIRTLAGLMTATGRVTDEDAVVRAALARVETGTTGIGDGIAIPHAKSNGVTAPVLAFARSKRGPDWKSADGSQATLIFMIAVPAAAAGTEHLKVLAQMSRALMKPAFRSAIQSATTPAEVLEALAAQVSPVAPASARP